jgi:hypothetical protein
LQNQGNSKVLKKSREQEYKYKEGKMCKEGKWGTIKNA